MAVLIQNPANGAYEDRTKDIRELHPMAGGVRIAFRAGRPYEYGSQRVLVLENPKVVSPDARVRIAVEGQLWENVTEAYHFTAQDRGWWHIFYGNSGKYAARPTECVEIIPNGAGEPRAAAILAYWKAVAERLPEGGQSLREAYSRSMFVHPESALYRYLHALPIEPTERPASPPLYPFHTNLSQRAAIENALRHTISVIDGPPGTGKTQTILNLIANVIVDESKTVAVVSSNNTAVDNVHTKLTEAGFGYVTANLGRVAKQDTFFAEQLNRNQVVEGLRGSPELMLPRTEEMVTRDGRLLGLREAERQLAQLNSEHANYGLERSHFMGYFDRHELPDQEQLPVLRWGSAKILAFIAATDPDLARTSGIARMVDRIGNYFRYRSMRYADAQDVDVVLRLQRLYYDKKIAELEQLIGKVRKSLDSANFEQLAEEQRQLSVGWLTEHLRRRYADRATRRYDRGSYRRKWAEFRRDYPVILSTCHSLERSIGSGQLIDYLVIDEASQVDLLAAGVALASCRNLIIVGDLRQLQPIDSVKESACPPAPAPAYRYQENSILSSLIELYGDSLPRVMLREHYRCDPSIIGFCNQKFYEDNLIPFTLSAPGYQSMVVARTVEGNHMRQFGRQVDVNRGRINQREIDVIQREVLPRFCADFPPDQIGVTTPYRKQADRVTDALIESVESIESDTVHSFQGREKDAIVMTTVLDETKSGHAGLRHADGPELVNVAVSRARKRFVLVTNHDMLPQSRNLRDLIGYIHYQNLDKEVFDSSIVSVFDLLYRDYSMRLRPLAARVRRESDHKSEDIMRTVLEDLLRETEFHGLGFKEQVLLKNLLPDTNRLTPDQQRFVRTRSSSVDFDLYNRVTKQRVCVIEVDGFEFHENDPKQLARDVLKNAICRAYRIPLLRFPTTGSDEVERLRRELAALVRGRTAANPTS
ncbi:AAA family ATPase [Nocardia uniformis]|uniref:AAA family ATPase n=1 Tax=Nocardia uniformis TaxID=53432 RepID=A0A849C2N2_9NOCA|nr:AAA domain-containing protein [Nocardia uniformis]NNH72942.1 AAA family ATPase [Nocardia uniformis]